VTLRTSSSSHVTYAHRLPPLLLLCRAPTTCSAARGHHSHCQKPLKLPPFHRAVLGYFCKFFVKSIFCNFLKNKNKKICCYVVSILPTRPFYLSENLAGYHLRPKLNWHRPAQASMERERETSSWPWTFIRRVPFILYLILKQGPFLLLIFIRLQ
jgi:hypothetical protein